MRYFDGCPFLKVSRFRDLWCSNIHNLHLLKQQAAISGFVAIDAEPWGNSLTEVAEFGVAFIPIVNIKALQDPPTSLESLRARYSIETSTIRVVGRQPGQGRKREGFVLGSTYTVEPEAVHETLLGLFRSFQSTLGAKAPLILLGFDLTFEFRVISNTYLGITEYVSSWVDVQEIIKEVSSCSKRDPSMGESLIALGFANDSQAILPDRIAHSAGTDALRVIALLVSLLAFSPETTLEINRRPTRKWGGSSRVARRYMKANNHFSGRPKPRECYPFRARVRLFGGQALSLRKLSESFMEYNLMAIGIHGAKHEGYICLAELKELNYLVERVHGSQTGNGELWEVISEFDPQLTSARTATELLEFLELKSTAVIKHKQCSRKQAKEMIDLYEGCWTVPDSLGLLGLSEL